MAHTHDHDDVKHIQAPDRALKVVLVIVVGVMALEIAGSFAFHSLALAADAAHMCTDALALAIAVIAQHLARRPATDRYSFGWRRAEVLAAQGNALLLLVVSGFLVYEAIQRLSEPASVDAAGMIAIALIGLVANLLGAWLLYRASHDNMNIRAAFLHTLGDAAASVAAVAAGMFILAGGSDKADSVAAIVVSVLVVIAAVRLMRDVFRVLLEGTPHGLDPDEVRRVLETDPAVGAVHHLHVWSVASGMVALSAHVEIEGEVTLHQAQSHSNRLKALLEDNFNIRHSTLELECHPCADESE